MKQCCPPPVLIKMDCPPKNLVTPGMFLAPSLSIKHKGYLTMEIGKFDENILSEARHVDSERTSNRSWWRYSAKWSAPHSLIGQCQPQRLCLCSWSGTVRKVDQWFSFFFRFLWNIFWHWFKSCYDVITITREVARTWYNRLPMSPWDKMMTALTNVYFHFFIIQTNAAPQLFLSKLKYLRALARVWTV